MAIEWRWLPDTGIAHAFVTPPGRSACGLVSWHPRLFAALADDARCADCEADLVALEQVDRRLAPPPLGKAW